MPKNPGQEVIPTGKQPEQVRHCVPRVLTTHYCQLGPFATTSQLGPMCALIHVNKHTHLAQSSWGDRAQQYTVSLGQSPVLATTAVVPFLSGAASVNGLGL